MFAQPLACLSSLVSRLSSVLCPLPSCYVRSASASCISSLSSIGSPHCIPSVQVQSATASLCLHRAFSSISSLSALLSPFCRLRVPSVHAHSASARLSSLVSRLSSLVSRLSSALLLCPLNLCLHLVSLVSWFSALRCPLRAPSFHAQSASACLSSHVSRVSRRSPLLYPLRGPSSLCVLPSVRPCHHTLFSSH